MSDITLVAIDLAKTSFVIRAENHKGKAMEEKKVSREDFFSSVTKYPLGVRIVMEACGSANYWGRRFQESGYRVDMIAAQHVTPFVGKQKNDVNDARGIACAASREDTRLIPVKPVFQQEVQTMLRIRERHTKTRVSASNALHGFLLENGIALPKGVASIKRHLPDILVDEQEMLSARMKKMLRQLYEEFLTAEQNIKESTQEIMEVTRSLDVCKRLITIPGIGVITAAGIYAAVGHMKFKNGRGMAAYLGLVPRQRTTGGKEQLGRITKSGNRYLRCALIHGARSVLRTCEKHKGKYYTWAEMIRNSKGYAKGAVAVANKNARIAWSVLSSNSTFEGEHLLN